MPHVEHGHLDGFIGDAFGSLLPRLPKRWTVIVRALDSDFTPKGVSSYLTSLGVQHSFAGPNVCLTMEQLAKAHGAEAFSGFDELLFFDGPAPDVELECVPLTSCVADFTETVPPELTEWMERTNCVLILGDGCGLNYATTERGISRVIRSRIESCD